ncbi:hypothetical protein AGMMS50268_04380 [Spirochaetia bacterium]|nr:hypothetical protein AGMMS50268_04380 [Spirochaetia bacterium]
MNTHPFGDSAPGLLMAALIPHRDSRKLLRLWSGKLFAAGLSGAWSFPWAVPLGLISRPLSGKELNALAHALRESTLAAGRNGKMQAGAAAALPFPELAAGTSAEIAGAHAGLSLFGPALDLRLSEPLFAGSAAAALVRAFPYPVLASAIINDVPPDLPPPPAISFRAAAVANMIYRPLAIGDGSYSFEWQIGELHWLPAIKNKKKGE